MKLPAYGRDLMEFQKTGRNVSWLVIALDWWIAKPFPRVVVPEGQPITELDLSFVAGIDCSVIHDGECSRALDVAELALRCGATRCTVHDKQGGPGLTSSDVIAIRGMA